MQMTECCVLYSFFRKNSVQESEQVILKILNYSFCLYYRHCS